MKIESTGLAAGLDMEVEERKELRLSSQGFPGGSVVKNPPANAGDTGLIPGLGRSHMPQIN